MEGMKYKLNGGTTSAGNYVWGGALTLAWKQLANDIVHQQIRIKTKKEDVLKIVENFNQCPFTNKMLSPDCCYTAAGLGNETVAKINQEVKKKFPGKTTPPFKANLSADSIISYAYFFKKLKFEEPFKPKQVTFENKQVSGFEAKNHNHRKQVEVWEYNSDDDFVIELKSKSENDHIFFIKNKEIQQAEEALRKISSLKQSQGHINNSDAFQMPKVSLKHGRSLKQLEGTFLANKQLEQYFFGSVYEIINLEIDESGVKVENEGVIKMKRKKVKTQNREFILDEPFWIVMRQKDYHPYLVAFIKYPFEK